MNLILEAVYPASQLQAFQLHALKSMHTFRVTIQTLHCLDTPMLPFTLWLTEQLDSLPRCAPLQLLVFDVDNSSDSGRSAYGDWSSLDNAIKGRGNVKVTFILDRHQSKPQIMDSRRSIVENGFPRSEQAGLLSFGWQD